MPSTGIDMGPLPHTAGPVTQDLNASAKAIWSLLVHDFGGIASWWPMPIPKVEVEGEGVGMVRYLHTGQGMVLPERLDAFDENDLTISVAIDSHELPAGLEAYMGRGRVEPLSPTTCRLHWWGEYRMQEGHDPSEPKPFLDGVYAGLMGGLAAHAPSLAA